MVEQKVFENCQKANQREIKRLQRDLVIWIDGNYKRKHPTIFTEATMAKTPEPKKSLELTDADPFTKLGASTN